MNEIRELLPPDVLAIVLDTYETALHYAFSSAILMAVLALISSLFIQHYELATQLRK